MQLYLIPTWLAPNTAQMLPIEFIREAVQDMQYFLVENERTARRFLSDLGLGLDIRSLNFLLVDKKTKPRKIAEYFEQIPKGAKVGVMSEAGIPCVADPGSLVVAYAHQQSWEVIPIPGPSSLFLALMGSGFQGQRFSFHGYLPIESKEASIRLKKIEERSRKGETQIFMETPYRNNQLLRLMCEQLHPETKLCIASNLTAPDQYLKTMSIAQWRKQKVDLHKKPTIFVVGE